VTRPLRPRPPAPRNNAQPRDAKSETSPWGELAIVMLGWRELGFKFKIAGASL
jgi:hypothetical protein